MNGLKINYIIIPLITFLVAMIGSYFSGSGVATWYTTLKLPVFAPAGWIIGLVWTGIFVLSTLSALIFWNNYPQRDERFWIIVLIFLLNAFLNLLWSFLFFNQHAIFASLIEMIFLWLTVLALVLLLWPFSRQASLFLAPYLVWVLFATFLTYEIFRLNK